MREARKQKNAKKTNVLPISLTAIALAFFAYICAWQPFMYAYTGTGPQLDFLGPIILFFGGLTFLTINVGALLFALFFKNWKGAFILCIPAALFAGFIWTHPGSFFYLYGLEIKIAHDEKFVDCAIAATKIENLGAYKICETLQARGSAIDGLRTSTIVYDSTGQIALPPAQRHEAWNKVTNRTPSENDKYTYVDHIVGDYYRVFYCSDCLPNNYEQ